MRGDPTVTIRDITETRGRKVRDLTGQRFGKLVVLYPTEERRNGSVVWVCRCDCSKLKTSAATHLLRGMTKSCGCKFRESMIARKMRYTERSRLVLDRVRGGETLASVGRDMGLSYKCVYMVVSHAVKQLGLDAEHTFEGAGRRCGWCALGRLARCHQ
jgi:hypothetical protein